ncbi:MAG: hypothetical protein ACRDTF_17370, partial [Pseudonocardiaceae bacterium]
DQGSEMNMKSPRRGQNFFEGGSMIGNAFGNNSKVGNVTVTSTDEAGATTLEDLQEAIALLREQIEAADGSAVQDDRLQYELQTIEEELDEEEPDGAAVRSRWKQVQKLLGPLQHVAGIAHSTEQILTFIRAL